MIIFRVKREQKTVPKLSADVIRVLFSFGVNPLVNLFICNFGILTAEPVPDRNIIPTWSPFEKEFSEPPLLTRSRSLC